MLVKLGSAISLGVVLTTLAACAGMGTTKKEALTIADVNPKLSELQGTSLDAVKKQDIQYAVTGKEAYDKFFKEAAIAYGGFTVAKAMSEDVALNLKTFAQKYAQSDQASKAVKEMAKDKDLSVEVATKILEEKKKELGKLDAEEREYFGKAAYNVAASTVSLKGSTEASARLLPQAQTLIADAKTAFNMVDSPGVTQELQASATKLSRVTGDAAVVTKNLTVLTGALGSLAGKSQ
jgi:hypothetical protein